MAEALAEQFKKVPPHTKTLFISGYTEDVITHHGALDTGRRFCKSLLNHQTLIRKEESSLNSRPNHWATLTLPRFERSPADAPEVLELGSINQP